MMATIRLSKSPSAKRFRRDKPETMHPALPGASRLQFLLRGPADCLRRLTEGAQESAAHDLDDVVTPADTDHYGLQGVEADQQQERPPFGE